MRIMSYVRQVRYVLHPSGDVPVFASLSLLVGLELVILQCIDQQQRGVCPYLSTRRKTHPNKKEKEHDFKSPTKKNNTNNQPHSIHWNEFNRRTKTDGFNCNRINNPYTYYMYGSKSRRRRINSPLRHDRIKRKPCKYQIQ